MYEAGFLTSDYAVESISVPPPDCITEDSESWFTAEERAQFRENRRRLEEEWAKNPPPLSKEEFLQSILNGPVADEETIQRQNEVREEMRRWTIRSW
jgi:hypothetical protein